MRELLNGGAELRKTEDVALLLAEDANLRQALDNKGSSPAPADRERYRKTRDDLMTQA